MYKLPSQENINIEALNNLFKNTHTSYKYLLFQAILLYLGETYFKKTQYSFMEFSDLRKPNNEVFLTKYKEIIIPLSTLAKNSGFDCDWVYKLH